MFEHHTKTASFDISIALFKSSPGLEKSMVVLDVPLPTIEEGKRLLQVLCHTQDVELNRFVRAICQRFLGSLQKKKYNDCILDS